MPHEYTRVLGTIERGVEILHARVSQFHAEYNRCAVRWPERFPDKLTQAAVTMLFVEWLQTGRMTSEVPK